MITRRQLIQQLGVLVPAASLGLPALVRCKDKRTHKPSQAEDSMTTPATTRFVAAYRRLSAAALAQRADRLWNILSECQLCPRACKVNRLAGQRGVCGLADELKVSSAFPHFGEERPLVGWAGSGTIFFSHCNLLCCFCQNWEIAHRGDGDPIRIEHLATIFLDLQKRGCHNINVVTPTHVVPHIVRAVCLAAAKGLHLPIVYNTGGYDSLDVIRLLDGIVDIYMPDCKFQSSPPAKKFCRGAGDYPQVVRAVIEEMHRQVGLLQFDKKQIAQRGLLIRHLGMPNQLSGTE